jgi:GLPGLI family protein
MENNKSIAFLFFYFISTAVFGQSTFYNEGRIRYERKTNAFRLTEGAWINKTFEKQKFQTDTFNLDFNSSASLYYNPSYDPDEINFNEMYFSMRVSPSKTNIVYKNLKKDTLWVMRDLFEERLLITDSLRNIDWKITGEKREIAGFNCQKAVGILFDSMYVVAFFTDQILPKSGPETFGKLPGMIMGIAIPRLYTSWMAIDFKPDVREIKKPAMPKKKKSTYNWNQYYTKISESFKDWGNLYSTLMVWMWGV